MRETLKNLESEAVKCLSNGHYVLAERLYHVIFLSLFERQYVEKRRIHQGGPLHMRGTSLLQQNRFSNALSSFLLAYITDLVNVPSGEEDKADQYHAYRNLKNFFGVSDDTFQSLKTLSKKICDRNQPFNPQILLDHYLLTNSIPKDNVLSLATHKPTPQQIRSDRPR
jgi:hypothetical protein